MQRSDFFFGHDQIDAAAAGTFFPIGNVIAATTGIMMTSSEDSFFCVKCLLFVFSVRSDTGLFCDCTRDDHLLKRPFSRVTTEFGEKWRIETN